MQKLLTEKELRNQFENAMLLMPQYYEIKNGIYMHEDVQSRWFAYNRACAIHNKIIDNPFKIIKL